MASLMATTGSVENLQYAVLLNCVPLKVQGHKCPKILVLKARLSFDCSSASLLLSYYSYAEDYQGADG